MKTADENVAALEAAIKKIKDAQQAEASALVVQPRSLTSGRFTKKAQLTKAEKSTLRLQNILTKKDAVTGKTTEEKLVEHLIGTAMECGPKDLMAAAKTYATVEERAWGRVAPSEAEVNANTAGPHITAIYIHHPDLPNTGEWKPNETPKPNFGAAPFVDAELVEQNPRLTTEEMDPYKDVKKPEAKPKAKPEPMPSVPCTCIEDSPMYCAAHRPY